LFQTESIEISEKLMERAAEWSKSRRNSLRGGKAGFISARRTQCRNIPMLVWDAAQLCWYSN